MNGIGTITLVGNGNRIIIHSGGAIFNNKIFAPLNNNCFRGFFNIGFRTPNVKNARSGNENFCPIFHRAILYTRPTKESSFYADFTLYSCAEKFFARAMKLS